MQAHKPPQGILYDFNKNKKEKMYSQKLKVFINSKVKILLKNSS